MEKKKIKNIEDLLECKKFGWDVYIDGENQAMLRRVSAKKFLNMKVHDLLILIEKGNIYYEPIF
jgi:hypothetical protein